jgi:PAS domain S-box-containing protein
MRRQRRVRIITLTLAGLVWLIDAALDALFFYREPLAAMLITAVPAEKLSARLIFLGALLLPNLLMAREMKRRELLEKERRDAERRRHTAEQALVDSERRYRELFENAPLGIFQTTIGGAVRMTNTTMANLAGCKTPEEAVAYFTDLAKSFYVDPRRRETFIRQITTRGEVKSFRAHARKKTGEKLWLSLDARLSDSRHAEGRPLIDGFARDITDRVAAEAALRESERRLKQAEQVAHIGHYDLDLRQGTALWSDETYRIFALDPESPPPTMETYKDFILEEDQEQVYDLLETCRREDRAFDMVYRIRRADGQVRFVHSLGEPRKDADDEVIGLFGTLQDITDQQRAERARELLLARVREQAHQLEEILATVPEGVVMLNPAHRVEMSNPLGREALLVLADADVGDVITHLGERPLTSYLTPPPAGLWHEVEQGSRTYEIIARPMASPPKSPETAAAPWVLVIEDVTEERRLRRQAQQQEQLASVGQLAAGIAHDFNNIMAVMVLYSQMGLGTPDLPTRLRDYFQTIYHEAQHATDLINQILDFSRRTDIERRPVNLVTFLKEQAKLLRRTLPESIKINLTFDRRDHTVNADPSRLQQALMNLAVNARDAMPQGGSLDLEVTELVLGPTDQPPLPAMEPGPWIKLDVVDTGCGIEEEIRPKIFEPFFTTKGNQGHGLGLPQVHGIVSQHEGAIDVESRVGVGTTFTLYLPALLTEPKIPEEPRTGHEAVVQGAGETVLIVEDNPTVRHAMIGTLKELGYHTLAASHGREALTKLAEYDTPGSSEIDLVLSDLVMPEMGGLALFQAMQARSITIPMVIVSGYATEEELTKLQAQGLAGWLPKPVELAVLAKLLAQVLEEAEA